MGPLVLPASVNLVDHNLYADVERRLVCRPGKEIASAIPAVFLLVLGSKESASLSLGMLQIPCHVANTEKLHPSTPPPGPNKKQATLAQSRSGPHRSLFGPIDPIVFSSVCQRTQQHTLPSMILELQEAFSGGFQVSRSSMIACVFSCGVPRFWTREYHKEIGLHK